MRVAFLVQEGEHEAFVLDAIFADAYARWGGRFSLVVPCVNAQIPKSYWPWLTTFDPDIVYSYVEFSREQILEIHERVSPSQYKFHEQQGGEPRTNVFGFKPEYGAPLLSSLSTIFRQARYQPATPDGRLRLVDSWHTEEPSRFLTDNLGTYHQSQASSQYPQDAQPAATLLTIIDPATRADPRRGVPKNLDTVGTELEAFELFRQRKASSLSIASLLFAPKLETRTKNWSTAFNLVVGDSFADRVMFWNARLLIPSWLDDDLCCLRVGWDQLHNAEWLAAIGDFLKFRNNVNSGSGGQPNITVRSCSLDKEQLAEALGLVHSTKPWGVLQAEHVASLDELVPSADILEKARETTRQVDFHFRRPDSSTYEWEFPTARPPHSAPDHLADAPARQYFVRGYWCAEHGFEYPEGGVQFSNENYWMLPRRWRMAGAFKVHAAETSRLDVPPASRRTRHGNLGVFVSIERQVRSITVPTAEEAIRFALAFDGAWAERAAEHGQVHPPCLVAWTEPSNEAGYLTGVLGMVGSIDRATAFFLHPFLRSMFARLGGAPNPRSEKISSTVQRLKKTARTIPVFDLRNERERDILGTLITKASREQKNPMTFLELGQLKKDWAAYCAAYSEAHPRERAQDDGDESARREAKSLDDCLVAMRRRRILFQGHRWICARCHHRNWVDMGSLASELTCEICSTKKDAPVSFEWLFRPNEFLVESLRDHSVLSLVWLLSELRLRARNSFIYTGPTAFVLSPDSRTVEAEADLLLLIDGEATVCEVKSSWSLVAEAEIQKLVELAKRLRADVAILGVMEAGEFLLDELGAARDELASVGIRFECVRFSERAIWDGRSLI